jgi:hypothetical protein
MLVASVYVKEVRGSLRQGCNELWVGFEPHSLLSLAYGLDLSDLRLIHDLAYGRTLLRFGYHLLAFYVNFQRLFS